MGQVILVAGGTGFLGSAVVRRLESRGHKVVISSRKQRSVPTHADVIVNCAGIIREDRSTFEDVHVNLTKWLVGLGKKLKVRQFVQVSALGADLAGTPYQRTKAVGEKIVRESELPYVILRPSMIFGAGDKSINRFRAIARTGFFPVLAQGTVQPVSVETVADVIVAAVEKRIRNRTVEVGGPEVFTYAQLAQRIHPGVRTFWMPRCGTWLLTKLGVVFISLPTADMVKMMRLRNETQDVVVQKLGVKNPRLV